MDQNQNQHQQQRVNSGLMRYRSAPTSYFTNLINSGGIGSYGVEDIDPFINPRLPSPETERILARFISGVTDENLNSERNNMENEAVQVQSSQFVGTMKTETENFHQYQQESGNKEYDSGSRGVYEGRLSQNDDLRSPVVMDRLPQMKIGVGGVDFGESNSNLIRHSSSPAGLFAKINVETAGYSGMRGMRGAFSSSGRHSSRLLPRIPEMREKSMGTSSTEDHRKNEEYITGFQSSSWDDSILLSDNFLKGLGENDRSTFSNFNPRENQEGEGGTRPPNVLTHHLSLPTSSSELSALERVKNHFQESVPLRIRAKRGCATHPRSIAERVRRTRISERMRKLQDLVPNMDKQTNTADMLDLAVDYIKDLQNQATTLANRRAKCKCPKQTEIL